MNRTIRNTIISLLPLIVGGWLGTSCDSYIDITPKGAITVDSVGQYYELIVDPMRGYQPSAFAFLSDDMWSKESNIIGYENISSRPTASCWPTTTSTRTCTSTSCA